MTMLNQCPACGGVLVQRAHNRVLTREHDHIIYPALYSECYGCGEQLVSPEQMKVNDEERAAAMSADSFDEQREDSNAS